MRLVKETFGAQFFFELLKGERQHARAFYVDASCIQLIGTVALIDGDISADDDLHPVFRRKPQIARIAVEHHAFHAGRGILECKVTMPRGIPLEVGKLAAYQDVRENRFSLEHTLDIARYVADTMNRHNYLLCTDLIKKDPVRERIAQRIFFKRPPFASPTRCRSHNDLRLPRRIFLQAPQPH